MIALHKLPTTTDEGAVNVVVESPRGSEVKLKYEPEHGVFTISRPLVLGLVYPFDWGFIPSTRAPDGDPLDAMVLADFPTFPGVVVPCRPIAVIEVEQDAKNKKGRERNDRILAVPVASARGEPLHGPKDIAERVREELERFFVVVTGFADKNIEIRGWGDAKAAEKLVRETQLKPKKRRR